LSNKGVCVTLERARRRTRLVRPEMPSRRILRNWRTLRAAWHDTAALWREFRTPVLLFIFVTIGGGFIYGELYFLTYGDYYALDVRPYIMLQLMIMEPPSDVPPEWHLIIFWYLMPFYFLTATNGVMFGERQSPCHIAIILLSSGPGMSVCA
jgi:hypothetical protein